MKYYFNKKKFYAALFANKQMNTYKDVIRIVGKYFNIYDISFISHDHIHEYQDHILSNIDLVISIFNPVRIRGTALSLPNFNIHAAPTWYRGIGAIGRAIADKKEIHGIVVHEMVYEYDAGEIFLEEIFDIRGLTASDIGNECVKRSLNQLENFCRYFSINGVLPPKEKSATWKGEIMHLGEFRAWLDRANFLGKEEVINIYSQF